MKDLTWKSHAAYLPNEDEYASIEKCKSMSDVTYYEVQFTLFKRLFVYDSKQEAIAGVNQAYLYGRYLPLPK